MTTLSDSSSAKADHKPAATIDVPGALLTKVGDIYASEERRRREKAFDRAVARASVSVS